MTRFTALAAASTVALLSGCATASGPAPQDRFFAALQAYCGQSFEGRVASPPVEADRDFAGRIVMEVRDCTDNEIRIPVAVGDDRSRTWIIRKVDEESDPGLSLHHQHLHADGTPDAVSLYGGRTDSPGTETRQLFPADAFSKDLFRRENIPQSVDNVWAVEVHPGRLFAYELRRSNRFFRLEFDLSAPVRAAGAS